jgi:hypothetical protein
MTKPYLALGLSGPHLVELTSSAALLERWDLLEVAFTVLGIDRIDGSPPARVTLNSSAVGATLASATKSGRFLITVSPQRDHPYNIARRVASLAHLSRGRSGVLVGVRDSYAPPGPADAPAWGGAGLGGGALLNVRTAYDTARAVRALEQSWPYDTIIGDRESGILVQSDRIVHVDIDGSFSIAGPLNAPEPATGASVIAWYDGAGDELPNRGDDDPIDLMLGKSGDVAMVPLGHNPPVDGVSGVLLRASAEEPLGELFDAAQRLLEQGFTPIPLGGSLRSALHLARPTLRTAEARPAFPSPKPHVAL